MYILGSLLAWLQDSGGSGSPSETQWVVILTAISGAMGAVFTAYTLSQKELMNTLKEALKKEQEDRVKDREEAAARERERVKQAEDREDAAVARLEKLTDLIEPLTLAVREVGPIGKAAAEASIKSSEASIRDGDKIDGLKTEFESLRRSVDAAINRTLYPPTEGRTRARNAPQG